MHRWVTVWFMIDNEPRDSKSINKVVSIQSRYIFKLNIRHMRPRFPRLLGIVIICWNMDILWYTWSIICVMFILLMKVYSQLLYENDIHWNSELNRDTDKVVIQSTLRFIEVILKKTQSELEVSKTNAHSVSVSYDELLKMFNKRELPRGTFKFC